MRTADDARRDPQPGDVFQRFVTRRVIAHDPTLFSRPRVAYQTPSGTMNIVKRESFLRWAKDAEVLEVANG